MSNSVGQRTLGIAAVLAIAAGVWTRPPQASAAWTVGTPIVTYWNAGSTLNLTNAMADQAVAGGYNLVWVTNVSQVTIAQSHGLRAQMSNSLLSPSSLDGGPKQAQLDSLIDQYKASPAAYSYFIVDEPSATAFSTYAPLVAYLRQRDPDHLAYINLFPTYASNAQLGTTGSTTAAYNAYLSQYVSTVQPALISYDHYQLMTTSDTSQYLQNLGLVRTAAKQAGVPFVNIVQACAWDSTWRLPNASELRFLAYSTAAYGAQGISYFNYYRKTGATGGLQPNSDGTPTSVYTALTPLNKEFKNIATQLQSMQSIGAYLKGYRSYALPPGTTLLPSSGSPFSISGVSDTSYSTGAPLKGVLLGLFDTDGTALADATFALVANLDYTNSHTYTVMGPGLLSWFNATTGVWTATGQTSYSMTLDPGGGVLVGLTSLVPVPEPSTIVLLGVGAAVMLVAAGRKQR